MKNKKYLIAIWVFIHLLSVILFFSFKKATIDTDLISIIPRIGDDKVFEEPVKQFFSNSSGIINIFVESENFDLAYDTSLSIDQFIKKISDDIDVNIKYDTDYKKFLNLISDYKYHLLANSVRDDLINGNAANISEEAIFNVFSPMFLPVFSQIDSDPFLLSLKKNQELLDILSLGSNSLTVKNNVLHTLFEEKDNIFFNIEIPQKLNLQGGYITFLDSFLPFISNLHNKDNINIYMSGVPIHSYYSQKAAQQDIIIISIVSVLVIFIIFYFVFRSIKPYLISIITILISAGFAYMITSILFDSIHIFTFVFGTSLIGITIDYSIHYITDFYFEKNGSNTLSKVLGGILFALLTTVISYLLLAASSISILKTLSVFSIFGMISTILTVIIIYPLIYSKNKVHYVNYKVLEKSNFILNKYSKILSYKKILPFIFSVIALLVIFVLGIKIDFSAEKLYYMPEFLLKDEIAVNERLSSISISDIIFTKGSDIEDILIKEENLAEILKGYNYLSLSKLIPSQKRQKENIELVRDNLLPMLDYQIRGLGFDESVKENITKDFLNKEDIFIDFNMFNDYTVMSTLNKQIFVVDDNYFSAIILNGKLDNSIKKNINEKYSDVKVFNIQEEINSTLGKSSEEAVKLTIIAYALIFIIIAIYFKSQSIFIIFIQIFSLLLNIFIHAIFSIEINIFSILAFILSLGISIDYTLFFLKSKSDKGVIFLSIFLSMLTTVLSFSTLAFSSFIPVKSFGISLFFGILFSFLLSPFVSTYKKDLS